VDRRQSIAAASFGMGPLLTLRRIILPQAMRAILPGMANQTISMIKGTSIASVIFVNELTFRSQQIVGQNFKFFTVLELVPQEQMVLVRPKSGLISLIICNQLTYLTLIWSSENCAVELDLLAVFSSIYSGLVD